MSKERTKTLLCSFLGAVASFLPFYEVKGGWVSNEHIADTSMNGFNSILVTTFVVFLIAMSMCFVGKIKQSFSLFVRIFLIFLSLVNIHIIAVLLLGDYFAGELSRTVSTKSLHLASLNGKLGTGCWIMSIMTLTLVFLAFAKKDMGA